MTDRPIGHSVGAGGINAKADTLAVQQLLNSVPREEGGPDLLLAEDGLIGPKTQAAINKVQKKVLSKPDGRIDPGGPTIKALIGVICGIHPPFRSADWAFLLSRTRSLGAPRRRFQPQKRRGIEGLRTATRS